MSQDKDINTLFNAAKNEPIGFSFESAKHKFQQSLSAPAYTSTIKKAVKSFKNLKIIIMSLTTLGTIILGITYFFSGNQESIISKDHDYQLEIEESRIEIVQDEKEVHTGLVKVRKAEVAEVRINRLPVKPIQKQVMDNELNPWNKEWLNKVPVKVIEQPYVYFPKLTPDEIEENDKQIKDMVKEFAKKKKGWTLFPSGAFEVDEKQISLQAFYVKTTEVTNLEYKTFLFDLLKNDNKNAFNKAKPNQQAWTEMLGGGVDDMTDMYFSHPAFAQYPVNNISVEGAQMYCDWFTQKVKQESKEVITRFRLPFESEWKYVASEMGSLTKYAWEGQFLRNAKGCYLSNFYAGTESDTVENNYQADGGMFTVKVDSYFPNSMGVYSISGNVAEMVVLSDVDEFGLLGGSFLSSAEELLIFSAPKSILIPSGSPDVGFRPVLTFVKER